MPVDTQRLTVLASQTGFIEQTLEKVLRLGEILADIERHPLLSRVLVLKGGSAINLCFGEPRRLSVDLAFNYVGSVNREAMLEAKPEIERAIATVVGAQGYALQRSADEHAGRKLFLNYVNASGTTVSLRQACVDRRSKGPKGSCRGRGVAAGQGSGPGKAADFAKVWR